MERMTVMDAIFISPSVETFYPVKRANNEGLLRPTSTLTGALDE